MSNIYLISEGAYSDYGVCFLAKSTRLVSEDELKVYWLEAIKRKTEYVDDKLEAMANYLGVAKQSYMYYYQTIVGWDIFSKAMEEVGYESRSETGFLKEVLTEHEISILPFEEYNVDDF